MQCHNCSKSVTNGGTPDEECLNCKGADYLYNKFKTITPVDDISKVTSKIEPTHVNHSSKTDFEIDENEYVDDRTELNKEDCSKIISVLKTCHHTSMKHIALIVGLFLSVGTSTPLLTSVLNEENLSQFANKSNISRQAASQQWNRLVNDNPIMKNICVSKRNKLDITNSTKKNRKTKTIKRKEDGESV